MVTPMEGAYGNQERHPGRFALLAGRDPQAVSLKDGLFDELEESFGGARLNAEIDDHLGRRGGVLRKRNWRNGVFEEEGCWPRPPKLDPRILATGRGTFDPKPRPPLSAPVSRASTRRSCSMYARGMDTVREDPGSICSSFAALRSPPDLHFDGDRRGSGDGGRMAEPSLWNRCIRWLSSTPCGSEIRDPGLRLQQGRLCRAWRHVPEGTRTVLGLWIETSEGANSGCASDRTQEPRRPEDILGAVVDGLKEFLRLSAPPCFRRRSWGLGIVHLVRNSAGFLYLPEDRKPIAAELKA